MRNETSFSMATDGVRNTCLKFKTVESQRSEKKRKRKTLAFLHNKYHSLFHNVKWL